jgi:MFS transporter, CP family, cyanate transporter
LTHPGTACTPWLAVGAAALCGVAGAMNVGKVPLALPLLRQELGLSLVQAGWVQSALNTVAVTLATAIGLQVGRLGALRLVLGGLLLGAAASLATLAHTGATWLLACRVLEGAGFVAVAVAGPALISAAAAERDRRFALGVWSGYLPAGVGLAMAGAPWLLPATGWRGLWVATAAGLLAAAALTWSQRRHYAPDPALRAATAPSPGSATAALRQPLPWLLGLCFGAWTVQHFALIVWLPTFLIEQRGLATGPVVALSCVMVLANVPGNLLGGALLQRGVPRGLLLALAHSCTGLAAMGLFSDALPDAWRYALCVFLSFIGGLIPSSVMSSSVRLANGPQQIGTLQGLYMQCGQLGQFVGTPLIAAVVSASGQWSSARWVMVAAAGVGLGLAMTAWRHESR